MEKGCFTEEFFSSPIMSNISVNHDRDCYFCMNYPTGFDLINQHKLKYKATLTVRMPIMFTNNRNTFVPECENLLNVVDLAEEAMEIDNTLSGCGSDGDSDEVHAFRAPSEFMQEELNNLVGD